MPRFELENAGRRRYSGVVRARDPEDGVRRHGDIQATDSIELDPADEFQGWMDIKINGEPFGRIREHDRMRFRRD